MSEPADSVLVRTRPRVSLLDFDVEEVLSFLRQRLQARGVTEAYLFGSFARGCHGAWSDLDVIIVAESELPFVERPRAYGDLLDLGIPVDVLVYTPDEIRRLREEHGGFWEKVSKERIRLV